MFRIKICGVTNPKDALLAAEAGADAIGLNFYEKSLRHVTPDEAAEIVSRLREEYSPEQVQVVAVCVNMSLDDILWTIRDADLFGPGLCVQLHGDEPPELLRDLRAQGLGTEGHLLQASGHLPTVPVIRAFRWQGSDFSREKAYLAECERLGALPQAVMLDAARSGAYGGTGAVLDWELLQSRRSEFRLPLILAGGLNPENVAEAIAACGPDGVDVASGVESAPGRKDYAKVLAFVAAAKKGFAGVDG